MRTTPNILVVGGTGRVGAETIKALTRLSSEQLNITISGRNERRAKSVCEALRSTTSPHKFDFVPCDITQIEFLTSLVDPFDLVVHTAGPFQRKQNPDALLKAAMQTNVKYMDVCDDLSHAMTCKKLHEEAVSRGYSALISTGIYPGLSNLMAADACRCIDNVQSLKIYYHTAGTGGIGATVLASTFLILSEPAVCYADGDKVLRPPAGDAEVFDFEGRLGRKTTYLLNLPEVTSLHNTIAPHANVFAKFSTAPPIWNWLLLATAKLVPPRILRDREAMLKFSQFSLPIVRFVDQLSGARTGIVVVAEGHKTRIQFSFEHESLAACVGEATAAFACEFLNSKSIQPGIHFPEELTNDVQKNIIKNASLTANFCGMKEL